MITIDQAFAITSTLQVNADWSRVDFAQLQQRLKEDPKGMGRDFTRFLQAGARMPLGDLKIATGSFDVKKFIGQNWKLLTDEQDKKSAALAEVDFKDADFLTNLDGTETLIGGEEKLKRLRKTKRILYGATVFADVWADYQVNKENSQNSFLEKLYRERGITRMYFFGDVLEDPDGNRYVLCVYRDVVGVWDWGCTWLGHDFDAGDVAVVSSQA